MTDSVELSELHRQLYRIRTFEERASHLYRDGEVPGFVHLSNGQEAVPVGVCSVLNPDDVITSTHRGHGHVIGKGLDPLPMYAELMGRDTGTCGGYGGSMHIADPSIGIYGANGIVGAGLPIAVGAAFSMLVRGQSRVAVAFFGDGAVSTGAFHEAVNLAALWHLPVIFVCEENGYSEFTATHDQQPVPIEQRALAYGIPAKRIDGTDVSIVRAAARVAVDNARTGTGPTLLVATVDRFRGHYEGDPQRYRGGDRAPRDPLDNSRHALLDTGITEQEILTLESTVETEIEAAIVSARAAPYPEPDAIESRVLAGNYPTTGTPFVAGQETRVSRVVRAALDDTLRDDEDAVLLGIDVGEGGGVFGITKGLHDSHPDRVWDTPISETAILGCAIGAAMDGLHPIVEIMYLDFIGVCFDQILNQAAKLRFMTGGRANLKLVIRTQFGVGRSSGSQHSQSLESLLGHIPGLVVVMPSSVEDHYGLLRSAVESPDPVVFIENRGLYEKKGVGPTESYRAPLGKARIAREGTDITIVAASRAVWTALDVADELAVNRGIQCEVVDLRTVAPWDRATVLESVRKTSRLLTYFEDATPFGTGAEIAATVASEGFWSLDAPVRSLAGLASPVPYAPNLEAAWIPGAADLRDAIQRAFSE